MAAPRTATEPAPMPPPRPGTGMREVAAQVPPPQTIQLPETAPAPASPAPASPTPASAGSAGAAPSSAATEASPVGAALRRSLVWGPVAIGVAALLQMYASVQAGDAAARPLRMMTVVVEGGAGLVNGNPLLGVAVNVLVGLAVGVVAALLTARIRPARNIVLVGLAVGAGVFAVDHLLLGPLASQVLELRDPATLLSSRLVMGAVLGFGLMPRDA